MLGSVPTSPRRVLIDLLPRFDSTRWHHAGGGTRWALGNEGNHADGNTRDRRTDDPANPWNQPGPSCFPTVDGAGPTGDEGDKAQAPNAEGPGLRSGSPKPPSLVGFPRGTTPGGGMMALFLTHARRAPRAHRHRPTPVRRTDDKSNILRRRTFQIRKSSVSVSGERPGVCE